MKKLNLNENFISRIWENQSYHSDLRTTTGEEVKVLDFGKKNSDAGPDYRDAKVMIGNIIYNGSIEIHRSMNDWFRHNHKRDDKYNDLILQVVMWGNEKKSERADQPKVRRSRYIPTVILSDFLTRSIHDIWREVIEKPSEKFRLPCNPENFEIEEDIKYEWIDELGIKRLKYKTSRIKQRLNELGDLNKKLNWEKMLFEFICEALGYSKNKKQFLKLSGMIDLKQIMKLNPGRKELDAILFGLAGFLKDLRFKDEYITDLKIHWNELRDIIRKESLNKAEWNFFRLRPPNFPTLRIAYASGILFEILYKNLLKRVVEIFGRNGSKNSELKILFQDIAVSDYWHFHYNFGKENKSLKRIIGTERINDIITNVIIPVMILYSDIFRNGNLKDEALSLYRGKKKLKSSNEISRVMGSQLNIKADKISREQGLIHLHNFYCIEGKCKSCRIGNLVFRDDMVMEPLRIILY